jgi:hypothetical protein
MDHNFKKDILRLLKFVFSNNYFLYNDKPYSQYDGIAMGTPCAPELANLYLALKFDRLALELHSISLFKRYIDDVFGIIHIPIDKFIKFHIPRLQAAALPLTFTYSTNDSYVDFLDLTVFINNNSIFTKVYQKPLNLYSYLPPSTMHPPATISGFIKGEITRYHRLTSLDSDKDMITNLFFQRLIKRGYKRNFLQTIFSNTLRKLNLIAPILTSQNLNPIFDDFALLIVRYTNETNTLRLYKHIISVIDFNLQTKVNLTFCGNPSLKKLVSSSSNTSEQRDLINATNTNILTFNSSSTNIVQGTFSNSTHT